MTPNPGSPEAYALGCRCPILDNNHGKGCDWGAGRFWISGECPLHSKAANGHREPVEYKS